MSADRAQRQSPGIRYNAKQRTPSLAPAAERRARTPRHAASIPPAERRRYKGVRRESKEGVGGTRNPPIPPWPPEAATRLLPQPTATQGSATKTTRQRQNAKQPPIPCPCGSAPRKNAPSCRLQPPSEAAAFQGVKENPRRARVGRAQRDWSAAAVQPHGTLGANAHSAEPRNRNPPGPPWPPEAATRLRPQPTATQERAAKPARQQQNAKQHTHPLPLRQSAAPERSPRRHRPLAERRRFKG